MDQQIRELCQQAAVALLNQGITNPTDEQLKEAFLARIEAEDAIITRFITDKTFAHALTQALANEIYHGARAAQSGRQHGIS